MNPDMSSDLVPVTEDAPRLFEDVHLLAEMAPVAEVAVDAIEEGTRYHPSGVVEDYRRVEFR